MVEPKVVVPGKFAVMPQIHPDDIAALAAQGYRSIINNRPDGEATDQPSADDVRTAARKHGLGYEHMPVKLESITREDVDAFYQAVILGPPPVAAHCRTGKRSFLLWAAGAVLNKSQPVDALVDMAQAIGIDARELSEIVEKVSEPVAQSR